MTEEELQQQLTNEATRRQAFATLVAQYGERLYWKIRNIVQQHDDANDVLQNTFLKAWQGLDRFRAESKLSTWLYRIAINEALDHLRRERSKVSADEDITVANRLLADNYFDGDEAQALLHQAVASLPDVQRTVFTLRYFDNMKYADISQALGTSEGALKASYHIAVKKIHDYVLNLSNNPTSK